MGDSSLIFVTEGLPTIRIEPSLPALEVRKGCHTRETRYFWLKRNEFMRAPSVKQHLNLIRLELASCRENHFFLNSSVQFSTTLSSADV
jgi:hypothetical protein